MRASSLRRRSGSRPQRYVTGPDLQSALREEAACAAAGYATTVGFWDKGDRHAGGRHQDCIAAAAALAAGSQLSIKPPRCGATRRSSTSCSSAASGEG